MSRRTVVRGLAGAAGTAGLTLSLGACGIRLDTPTPTPPTPTRRPAPDERLLLDVTHDLASLIDDERRVVATGRGGPVTPVLLSLHQQQRATLVGRLTNEGVPTALMTGAPTPSHPATRPALTTPAALAARLDSVTAVQWSAVAAGTEATRGLVCAAYGMRLAGAALLGRTVRVLPTASPARAAIVARTQPLVYGFEVAAAQATGGARSRAVATLAALRTLELELSGSLTPAPGGFALPFRVVDSASATRLATQMMRTVVASAGAVAGPAPTAATLEDVARWSARVQALATGWGVPLTAFPGAR